MSEKPQQDQQQKEQQDQQQTEKPDRDTAQKDEQPTRAKSLFGKKTHKANKPAKAVSKKTAYLICALCALSVVAVIFYPLLSGEQVKSYSDLNSDTSSGPEVQYSSSDKNKMCIETMAALIAYEDDNGVERTLRNYFYGSTLSGSRSQKDSCMYSADGQVGKKIDRQLAEIMGISESKFNHNYTWLIQVNHKGDVYDGDTYGYSIYWAQQALTSEDIDKPIDVICYNTKTQTYENGTMEARHVDNINVALKADTFEAE
ncbi:MAG: hypothetical protein PHN26_07800 [Eubacteriaceae bacterium]|nr:hypothetical protein [Eubacteriaceae bacterium]